MGLKNQLFNLSKENKMPRKKTNKPPVVVVYKKRESSKSYYMKIINEGNVDDVLNEKARKPIIPHQYTIVELGLGSRFEDEYSKEYNVVQKETV